METYSRVSSHLAIGTAADDFDIRTAPSAKANGGTDVCRVLCFSSHPTEKLPSNAGKTVGDVRTGPARGTRISV